MEYCKLEAVNYVFFLVQLFSLLDDQEMILWFFLFSFFFIR